MRTFRIWCRYAEVGDGQYMATVCAIPDEGDAAGALDSESRVFTTLGLARQACAEMADHMRRRLEARGHTVSVVEFV